MLGVLAGLLELRFELLCFEIFFRHRDQLSASVSGAASL